MPYMETTSVGMSMILLPATKPFEGFSWNPVCRFFTKN